MDKLIPLAEAVAALIEDGDLIYLAGFTHLIPFAAGHEIIRQGKKDLTLARPTPDLLADQLAAAGCLKKLIFSYIGNPGVGSLREVRRQIEAGALEWEEYSHFGLISRLQAGAAGLPFMPMRSTGTKDLQNVNPQYRTVKNPYGEGEVVVVPALNPDVAVVHVQRVDREGNGQVWGILGDQKEAGFAARKLILTAEEIVSQEMIRSDPNRTLIPAMIVDAVCEVPHGAHPSYAQGYYDRDNQFYKEWDAMSQNPDTLQTFLQEWVYGVQDHEEYWHKLGSETHARLAVPKVISSGVPYGG